VRVCWMLACRLVRARKGFTLHDEPNVLVVHLKRFSAFSFNKISRHIAFKTRCASGGRYEWAVPPVLTRT